MKTDKLCILIAGIAYIFFIYDAFTDNSKGMIMWLSIIIVELFMIVIIYLKELNNKLK